MFIELTPWADTEREKVLIKADAVTLIDRGEDGHSGFTRVVVGGESARVKETPEEIIHLIAKAKMLSAIPPMTTMVDAWEQLVMSKE